MLSSVLRFLLREDIQNSISEESVSGDTEIETEVQQVENAIDQITGGATNLALGMRPLIEHISLINENYRRNLVDMDQSYRDMQERFIHLEDKLRRSEERCLHLEGVISDMKRSFASSVEDKFRQMEEKLRRELLSLPKRKIDDMSGICTKLSTFSSSEDQYESLETRVTALEGAVKKALDVMLPRVDELLSRYKKQSNQPTDVCLADESSGALACAGDSPSFISNSRKSDTTPSSSTTTLTEPADGPSWFFPWSDGPVDENTKALCDAAKKGKIWEVRYLLNAGVNVNARDCIGYSALYVASIYGHETIIALLLRRGADVHCRGCGGKTALHCAAMNGHAGCVPLLVRGGAHVRARDHSGWTPLHHAAANGHAAAVRALLAEGARCCSRDADGLTPADFARDPEVVALLLGGCEAMDSSATPPHPEGGRARSGSDGEGARRTGADGCEGSSLGNSSAEGDSSSSSSVRYNGPTCQFVS